MSLLDRAAPSTRHRVGLDFVDDLGRFGAAPALHTPDGVVSYDQLASDVADAAQEWAAVGSGRRLVQLSLDATQAALVSYLGALAAGHAVILGAPGQESAISAVHRPDSMARREQGEWTVEHHRAQSAHTLHPELALLLSTSGSTGSPKLVRLSWDNLASNTTAIVDALCLTADDVAATTLPLHYCYGLSVLHTHLAVGGSVLLTDGSVADSQLWAQMDLAGVTSLSGVPHTFDLLTAAQRSPGDLTTIRQVTQAGGRMAPERVRQWATRGQAEGWDLRVMYGQTEATARMAIATAAEVLAHPERVGKPLDGSRFEIRVDGSAVSAGEEGDLVHLGPNVMLGYATSPSDLSLGRTTHELETGDLARIHRDGTLEIVGRRSGFLKVLGLRIDVQRVEEALLADGHEVIVGGDDEGLHLLLAGTRAEPTLAAQCAATLTGLPPHRIGIATVDVLPRTTTGKPDRPAARTAYTAALADRAAREDTTTAGEDLLADLVDIYSTCLGSPDVDADSTFVGLRGDSLSYVEVAVHLEERLGTLPADWPSRTLTELAAGSCGPGPQDRSRHWALLDTTVVLRGLAITAIVAGHTKVATLLGGAHILLAVAGYNFARFAAALPHVRERVRATGSTVLKIVVPTALWTGIVGMIAGGYSLANVLLVNWVFGPDRWTSHWRLWFIEALVWILLAVTALLAVPRVHRWHTRAPFRVAAIVATIALVTRLDVFDLTSPPGRGTAPAVLWLFAIGWAAAHATHVRQRLYVCALLAIGLPGFMGNSVREATIAAGILLLVWCPSLPVPRRLVPLLSVLASSSLYIYLTHFQVYKATGSPVLNLTLSIGLGILTWWLVSRVTSALSRRRAPTSVQRHSAQRRSAHPESTARQSIARQSNARPTTKEFSA